MAATTTHLMTVEEFSRLPRDDGPVYHELHHGEIVTLTRPILKHQIIQARLRDYLKPIAPEGSFVDSELAFRPLPEHELRVADLAWISTERWAIADRENYIQGAPDLVIEVLSPSNTASEMNERERLCLENGAREFWVVDPKHKQVRVSTSDKVVRVWKSGDEIPLPLFGNQTLAVDEIFQE